MAYVAIDGRVCIDYSTQLDMKSVIDNTTT